ncbi:uncharacterized protein LOC105186970 [Harpegnathos saltator]|nr:uncharacterized protein LOC105186970 [Harpegnathos saltator]
MSDISPFFSPWSINFVEARSYSDFFNPNICHLCKKPERLEEEDNICPSCNMILYCQSEHELVDKENHEQICGILVTISYKYMEMWKTFGYIQDFWIRSRKNLLRLVKRELQRDMKPYEIQMIMFAKSCFLCHHQLHRNLRTCTECYCVNYCSEHKESFNILHSPNCAGLKSCFEVDRDIFRGMISQKRFIDINVDVFNKVEIVNIQKFLDSFATFKDEYLFYFYSDYLSGPLTLYYGMKNVNLHIKKSPYIIHIIAATVLDARYILAWEIILHALPQTRNHLKVILIGPEMQEACENVKVCSVCKHNQKTFEFQSYRMPLSNYVNTILKLHLPDVIIAFEADISTWDLQTVISKLKEQSCPFIVTAASRAKCEANIGMLKLALNASLADLIPTENKFSSLKAYRNFENDVSYRNKFLFIITSLRDLLRLYNDPITLPHNIGIPDIPSFFSPWASSDLGDKSYYDFFNPNVCHVCKKTPQQLKMECYTCSSCNVIFYCNNDHELMDKENHKDICEVLTKLSHSNLQLYYTSEQNWIKSRTEFLYLVKMLLQRDMKPYEIEMIMFAKSCFICHEQYNLQTCPECCCVNYCSDHAKALENHQSFNCTKLKSYLEIDREILLKFYSIRRKEFMNISADIISTVNIVDIQQFLKEFAFCDTQYSFYAYSDYLSGPLTLYYGMKSKNLDLDIKDLKYVVHIIAATVLDARYVLAWEIMLHILSKTLKHLKVVLIGPETQDAHHIVKVCYKCTQSKFASKFEFQSYRLLLNNYVNTILKLHPPDVIIAFEADIRAWDSRTEIISKLNRQSCPFIVTSASYSKCERNIQTLRDALGAGSLAGLTPDENKFSSLKAYRNFEDNEVYYRNQFLFIINNLSDVFYVNTDPNVPGPSHI